MKKSAIGKAASELTKKKFSEEISSHLTLNVDQINALFPKKADREELATLTDIVLNAANENQRKAKLIGNITKVAGAVVKILGKTAIPTA
jgi:hypothetical protein